MKCYICKKCEGHHWHYLNAVECCQDLSKERIIEKLNNNPKVCGYC